MWHEVLQTITTAALSTLGAFIPVLIIMLVHFWLRKRSYQQRKERTKFQIESLEAFRDSDSATNTRLFEKYNVQDILALFQVFEAGNMPEIEKNLLIQAAQSRVQNIFRYQIEINDLRNEIKYIEEYNISTYFGAILDRKFSGV